jgi:hypothetical protein
MPLEASEPSAQAAAALEAWLLASLPWLGAALLLVAAAGLVGVWLLLRRVGELARLGTRLDALGEIHGLLARHVGQRGDLDLRRIEHALLEMRDGQRRLEGLLLRTVEGARAGQAGATSGGGLAERIVDRLLVLGYERVQLVSPPAELAAADGGGGGGELEVLVEAHRNGVLCKGRARLRAGTLVDVEMKPAYSTFP